MDAVLSLLRAAAAAVVGLFVALGALVTGTAGTAPPPQPLVVATTTPTQAVATTTSTKLASSTPKKVAAVTSTVAAKPAATPSSAPAPAEPAAPTYSVEELNARARASLVNIICTTGAGGSFNPISGSGVIIDSRGIILTNAHVGQYFLLRDYPTKDNIQCVVRVGSPAQPRYTAELLYLPPAWIDANASKISSTSPSGTGQNDFAFLRITGTTNPQASLPSSFPALPMDARNPDTGNEMVLAAYPAGFLGGITISLNLYQTSAVATVGQLYTFTGDPDHVDLFSLGGTVVSQAGSSGGAVVNTQGRLQGLIVTEIPAETTGARDLRALTIGHVDRSLADEGLGGVVSLLQGDPAAAAAQFQKNTAPQERKALEDVLNKQY